MLSSVQFDVHILASLFFNFSKRLNEMSARGTKFRRVFDISLVCKSIRYLYVAPSGLGFQYHNLSFSWLTVLKLRLHTYTIYHKTELYFL